MAEEINPVPKKRPKMTLGDQGMFIASLLRTCQLSSPDIEGNKPVMVYAKEAFIRLTEDDFLRLETVVQTLLLFELHGADQMVRDKIVREMRGRRK